MKGKIKLHIIQVYLPTSTSGLREYTLDLYNCIEKTIIDATRANARIILMGDFNTQYEKYIKYYHRNGNSHWRDSIFTKLNSLRLVDTVALYQDITPSTPFNTFLPHQQSSSPTRIDYIWVSRNLIDKTINSNNYTPELYSSDHLGVYVSFFTNNLFKRKSIASLKQKDRGKTIYHYDQMNDAKWKDFADTVDHYHQFYLQVMVINNRRDLNHFWNKIENCIKKGSIEKIPQHKSPLQYNEQQPKILKDIYYDIKHVNKIIMRYNAKSWVRNKIRLINDWVMIERQLHYLSAKMNYNINLPYPLSSLTLTIKQQKRPFLVLNKH